MSEGSPSIAKAKNPNQVGLLGNQCEPFLEWTFELEKDLL